MNKSIADELFDLLAWAKENYLHVDILASGQTQVYAKIGDDCEPWACVAAEDNVIDALMKAKEAMK